jgi:hypothetical protein
MNVHFVKCDRSRFTDYTTYLAGCALPQKPPLMLSTPNAEEYDKARLHLLTGKSGVLRAVHGG